MRAAGSQTKSIQILTAVARAEAGMAGIGVMAMNTSVKGINSLREQAVGSPKHLHFRAVLRALQLGKQLRARDISVLSADEDTVKVINGEIQLEPGNRLFIPYMRVRALMHTYNSAQILAVPKSRIEPARKLAIAASRMPRSETTSQGNLFSAANEGQSLSARNGTNS